MEEAQPGDAGANLNAAEVDEEQQAGNNQQLSPGQEDAGGAAAAAAAADPSQLELESLEAASPQAAAGRPRRQRNAKRQASSIRHKKTLFEISSTEEELVFFLAF